MATAQITVKVSVAWWVVPYLRALSLFCWTMGTEPDLDKVARVINRGVRVVL